MTDSDPHILVVDDDARLRRLLSRYLAEQGFRVTTAAHVPEARDKLRAIQPDALVLDVMMPGETGLDLTATLRKDRQDLPVLLLTARGAPEDRIAGFESGADDYLGKPFEPYELVLRLRAMLRRAAPPRRPKPPGPSASAPSPSTSNAASCRTLPASSSTSPAAKAPSSPPSPANPARPSPARPSPNSSRWTKPANAPSTSRSPACAARSRPTPANPASSTPSAAAATC